MLLCVVEEQGSTALPTQKAIPSHGGYDLVLSSDSGHGNILVRSRTISRGGSGLQQEDSSPYVFLLGSSPTLFDFHPNEADFFVRSKKSYIFY